MLFLDNSWFLFYNHFYLKTLYKKIVPEADCRQDWPIAKFYTNCEIFTYTIKKYQIGFCETTV